MTADFDEPWFTSQPDEITSRPEVEGAVPPGLRGTFLRTGPGLFEVGPDPLNFFDGHALIGGLSFGDGAPVFRARYVRTKLYEAETRAKRQLKRRVFTNLPSRWSNLFGLDLGNNAMHDVYAWGGRVFAGNDPGHFALDGRTLETVGPEDWRGAVPRGWDMCPMPVPDLRTGRLIGWIKQRGTSSPDVLRFVELDPDLRVVAQSDDYRLAHPFTLLHSHLATPSWYVVMEQGLRLSPGRAIWGARPLWDALLEPEGVTAAIVLAPRGPRGPLRRIPLPAPLRMAFHLVNAFEDNGALVVDVITYEGTPKLLGAAPRQLLERIGWTHPASPPPTPRRFVIDVEHERITSTKVLSDVPLEAPTIAPSARGGAYRYAYATAPGQRDGARAGGPRVDPNGYTYFGGVGKIDLDAGTTTTWSAGERVHASPPAFAPRAEATGEDDGYVLVWTRAPRRDGAAVAILDARRIDAGPIATVPLGVHLPAVSHVRFEPSIVLAPP